MARLRERYRKEIVPRLMKELGYANVNQVPRLEKIVLNMGLGEAIQNAKVMDAAVAEITAIAGQKPVVTRSRKAIANFKLREGMPIGLRVTLRGDRMWEFFDRLVSVAVPRMRDFRGLEPRGFDGRGNFNLGLKEHHIFPEVSMEKSAKARGMNITFVTSAGNDKDGFDLLDKMGMPFKKKNQD